MRTLEILCITLAALGLILLYFQYKNQKTLEMLNGSILTIQQLNPSPQGVVDREFYLNETQQLKSHIESKTMDVHDHLNIVLQSIDGLYGEKKEDELVQRRSYTQIIDLPEINDPIVAVDIPNQKSRSRSRSRSQLETHSRNSLSKNSIVSNKSMSNKSMSNKSMSNKSITINVQQPLEEYDMNDIINDANHSEDTKMPVCNQNIPSMSTDSTTTKYPKLPELRLLCKSHKLSMVGSKKVLITRLIENGYEF